MRLFQFVLLVATFFFTGEAFAQRLEITLPAAAASQEHLPVPLIFGKLDGDQLLLGGEVIRLEVELTTPEATAPRVVAPPKATVKTTTARYDFKEKERANCTGGPRFQALLALIKAMKGKVLRAVWTSGDAWNECVAQVERSLSKANVTFVKSEEFYDGDGAALVLEMQETVTAPVAAEEPKAKPSVDAILPTEPRLRIADRTIPLQDGGWFVFRAAQYQAVAFDLFIPGYRSVHREVTPWPVSFGTTAGPAGSGILEVALEAKGEATIIVFKEMTPSSHDTVFDLLSGGGFSYGRGLPGETRGKRFGFAASASRREVLLGFGLHGSLSGTYAKSSVLPWTLIADLTATKTFDWANGGTWRVGAGGRFFQAKIKATSDDVAKQVPEQVLAPIVEGAAEKSFGSLLLSGVLVVSPLYVAGAGFFPSFNPRLEAGWMIAPGAALLVGFGSDTVRYPTIDQTTSLRVDSLYFTYRRGI